MPEGPKVEHLVADTNVFIKNLPLQDISSNVYTVQTVVDEIKNKRQLRRLAVLPYDLKVKDVFTENVKFVTEFSKKTGDYPSLSAVDIQLLALTLQLEKEHVGLEHLKQVPEKARVVSFTPKPTDSVVDVPGFYLPRRKRAESTESGSEADVDDECQNIRSSSEGSYEAAELADPSGQQPEQHQAEQSQPEALESEAGQTDAVSAGMESVVEGLRELLVEGEEEREGSGVEAEILVAEEEEGYEEEDDDDIWDDNEWITPSNIKSVKQEIHGDDASPVVVACMTGDFAMQNVLRQLGLHALAPDGRQIREVRTHVLRCYACFKTTARMELLFCPHCGHRTLRRAAVRLAADGSQQVVVSTRRPPTGRGKRFALPKPQGGQHAVNPLLCADQRLPPQRVTRLARTHNNPLDPDYIAGYSPFVMRDVTSRSAMLSIRQTDVKNWMRRNPNEVKKKGKKK